MDDESAAQTLLLSRQDSVATVTLNRPDQHNRLTRQLKEELRDTLYDIADDESIRAVVLTGAGRSFCVGQDLSEHAEALRENAAHAFDTIELHYNPIVTTLTTMPKPVIAAINGSCVGAGLGFALACDLRVTADSAKFGTAFTSIGLTLDSGLSATLARTIGAARASELVLLGEMFTAQEALDWGIAGRLVPAEQLQATAQELAERLATGPTLAYAEAKRSLAEGQHGSMADILVEEHSGQVRLGLTEDHRDAVEAFLAKRKPEFYGK
jgi:2-(1,2-epoxy-1,2-dihydrophenyl)acetyl-CoA isomerase